MNSLEPAVACHGLVKRFSDVVAVDGLDLEVRRGECFGLLGPNGAGKTTIEILEGLQSADGGQVSLLGRSWKHDERELREQIGISLQETKFNEKLTVAETLRLFRSFFCDGSDPTELMREFSLEEKANAYVGKLSGGQRQRLAGATARVGKPEMLFLDEPTTGLDPQSRLQLWEQITRFRAGGGTVLLTTHYMDEAERLCDRIAIVDHGRRIALGTPSELIASLHAPHVIEFASEPMPDPDALLRIEGVLGLHRRGPSLSLNVDTLVTTIPALLEKLANDDAKLVSLSTHRATLEDVFVAMTGHELRDT
ncbi:MAG: ABC transporter ATP-binding protein [Thermoanaerobaculia bacterium]